MREGEPPLQRALRWAADVVGSQIGSMEPLRSDHSPWRLRFHGRDDEYVLRVIQPGWVNAEPVRTNAAALRIAEQHGLATPRLLAFDPNGEQAGTPATLETVLPGSSANPPHVSNSGCARSALRSHGYTRFPFHRSIICRC